MRLAWRAANSPESCTAFDVAAVPVMTPVGASKDGKAFVGSTEVALKAPLTAAEEPLTSDKIEEVFGKDENPAEDNWTDPGTFVVTAESARLELSTGRTRLTLELDK